MEFGLCPWSPTVALHAILNSGVVTALTCLNSLRLPSCARTPHISSGRSEVQDVIHIDFCHPYFSDTKELHAPCTIDTFIVVVTIERALRSLVLYSIFIKYYFTLPIGECKDGEMTGEAQEDNNYFNHLRDRFCLVSGNLSDLLNQDVLHNVLHGYSSSYDHVFGSVRGLHCTWLVPRTRPSSNGLDGFRLERVDPLEEGRSTVEDLAQSVYVDSTSCFAVGRLPCGEPRGA
ncbi:hypothetical protein M9H77_07059 [Catharanthus roseus]|uniref:Uncharacterized protein n=1 Tax=Catharanthus roseus TaxID=4058 RepID=A0ACC0BU32_CATRO|nr:hypothetical protein M9H77_07059 [Catharanthus roseus]